MPSTSVTTSETRLMPVAPAPGVMISTPPSDATITAALRPRNSPFSTTPTVMLIACSSCRGSAIELNGQSRMKLPPSVTKVRPSLCRNSGLVAEFFERRRRGLPAELNDFDRDRKALAEPVDQLLVIDHDDEALACRRDDLFAQQRAAVPLDQVEACRARPRRRRRSRDRCGDARRSSSSGMPSPRAISAVCSEVGIATTDRPCATRRASASTTKAAVEPVPRPSTMPLSTNSTARSAAARFRRVTRVRIASFRLSIAGSGAEFRIAAIAAA